MICSTEMDFLHSNFMLQTPHPHDHHHHHQHEEPSTSLAPILPSYNPQDFHGVSSLLGKRQSMSFTTGIDVCEEMNNHGEAELSDDGSQLGEKKRRLNMEQVKTLEKNFELGNKLEPERKMQLARALGLQPRQVAIWFQNRRARWKTKQLEKDYELLKRQFEAVKAENDALQAQNHKLHAEILTLKTREPTESINLNKETDQGSCSNRSDDNSSEIKLDISTNTINNNNNNPAIDSPSLSNHHHPPTTASISMPLFPSSSLTTARPHHHHGSSPSSSVAVHHQFFQTSSARPEMIPGLKLMDPGHHHHVVKEESLCNMFCGMDDQTGFWPWLEQQHFN